MPELAETLVACVQCACRDDNFCRDATLAGNGHIMILCTVLLLSLVLFACDLFGGLLRSSKCSDGTALRCRCGESFNFIRGFRSAETLKIYQAHARIAIMFHYVVVWSWFISCPSEREMPLLPLLEQIGAAWGLTHSQGSTAAKSKSF